LNRRQYFIANRRRDKKRRIHATKETRFVAQPQSKRGSPVSFTEIPRARSRPIATPLEHFDHHYADQIQAMAMDYLFGDYSMRAIADISMCTIRR
jgi:hypothetical protein